MTENGGTPSAALKGAAVVERRWKLIIAEDTEEFLRSDARARAGAALSRALNAPDGVLGRGTPVLVLFTTNKERRRLLPAVTRPGRCLSVIEFDAFSPGEAGRWLGTVGPTSGQMTLAELYEADSDADRPPVRRTPVTAGQYL